MSRNRFSVKRTIYWNSEVSHSSFSGHMTAAQTYAVNRDICRFKG